MFAAEQRSKHFMSWNKRIKFYIMWFSEDRLLFVLNPLWWHPKQLDSKINWGLMNYSSLLVDSLKMHKYLQKHMKNYLFFWNRSSYLWEVPCHFLLSSQPPPPPCIKKYTFTTRKMLLFLGITNNLTLLGKYLSPSFFVTLLIKKYTFDLERKEGDEGWSE